jgi:hypothetical protein
MGPSLRYEYVPLKALKAAPKSVPLVIMLHGNNNERPHSRGSSGRVVDRERPAPYTLAVGHGDNKVNALLSLWKTLLESDAVPEAIDVAFEYRRRTGKSPGDANN